MNLFLLLTALFASLTGASGEGTGSLRQVQSVAVVRPVHAAQAAVQPARRAIPAVAVEPVMLVRVAQPLPPVAPVTGERAAPERRLE